MQWNHVTAAFCLVCALLGAGCSGRRTVARYEGIDPSGFPVEVALYVAPFQATTPVCLGPAERASAEVQVVMRPSAGTGRMTLYLSRKHYSECGAEVFPMVAYWQTKPEGPEICFYRSSARDVPDVEPEVMGAWDYCALLHP